MIRAHVAQERNTRSAADFTKHSYRGLHRMLTMGRPMARKNAVADARLPTVVSPNLALTLI
jgi:hypothetical protein